jgi:hypothetical protein
VVGGVGVAAERRLVTAGGAEFFVEVADGGGPSTIAAERALSFDGVRATLQGVATELEQVWASVTPSEASVEFAMRLTVKAGRLTGLIVEGGGEAALKVSLTWKQRSSAPGEG